MLRALAIVLSADTNAGDGTILAGRCPSSFRCPTLSSNMIHWIGLRENLQETMVFTIKYRAFLQIFPSSNSMNDGNIWVLIKIKVSGAATIVDQPRINHDTNGVNRGRVLSYATLFCAENRQNIATYHSI